MTVEEQKTMRAIQIISRELQDRSLKGCKVKIFYVSNFCNTQAYEDSINRFISTHCIVDVKLTQSDNFGFAYIFYKE